MSQMVDGARKTFIASETGAANLRWYISDPTTSPKTVSLCDEATPALGYNEAAVLASSDLVTLTLVNKEGTVKAVTAGAITGGNKVYAAADGEVTSSGTIVEGIAQESVTTDQDILEIMPGGGGASSAMDFNDDDILAFGSSADAVMLFSDADASNPCFVVGIDDTSQQMHITDKGARATDWARSAGTHPELAIHSNTTPATDYLTIGNHDGTTATIDVVGGTTLDLDIAGTTIAALTATALTLADACNIAVNTTTGTKIGTAVGQKLGFWNVTPVVQPASADQGDQGAMTGVAVGDLVATNNGWGASSEANFDKIHTAIDQLVADVTALDTLLTAVRTALVNTGIMKGSA